MPAPPSCFPSLVNFREENVAERLRREASRKVRPTHDTNPRARPRTATSVSRPNPRRARSQTSITVAARTVSAKAEQYAPTSSRTHVHALPFASTPADLQPSMRVTPSNLSIDTSWMDPTFKLGAVSQPSTPNFPYQLAQQMSDSSYFEPLTQSSRFSGLPTSASFPFGQSNLSMPAFSPLGESSSQAGSPFSPPSSTTESIQEQSSMAMMAPCILRRPSSTDRAVASFLAQAEKLRREINSPAALPSISESFPVERRLSSWQGSSHLHVPPYPEHPASTSTMQSSGSSPSSRTSGASSAGSSFSAGQPHQGLTPFSPSFTPMETAPLDENLELNLGSFLPSSGSFSMIQGRSNDLSPWESDPGGPFSDTNSSGLSASVMEATRSSPPRNYLPLPSDVSALQGLAFDSGSTVQDDEHATLGYFSGPGRF